MYRILNNRITILIYGILTSTLFLLIYAKEGPPTGHAGRSFAFAYTYLIPLILGSMIFGWMGIVRVIILVKNHGIKEALYDIKVIIALILLLPAVYATLLMIIAIVASCR